VLPAERLVFNFQEWQDIFYFFFFYSTGSTLALRSTRPPVKEVPVFFSRVKRQVREAENSRPSGAQVKNA
jgi:hypothetical protein